MYEGEEIGLFGAVLVAKETAFKRAGFAFQL